MIKKIRSIFGHSIKLTNGAQIKVNFFDIIIDAGANVGLYTRKFAATGARVYAFEPNPFAFAKVAALQEQFPKLTVFQQAVWNKEEDLALFFHENSDEDEEKWSVGSSVLEFKGNVLKDKKRPVQAIDFSAFVFSLKKQVKLVKMDIEGAEIQVINHLIDTGAIQKIDFLIAEIHDEKIPELKQPTDLLKERIRNEGLEKKIDLSWH